MQIDSNMLKRLLAMNDDRLGAFIQGIATDAGIDPASLTLSPNNIAQIRAALGGASAEDLKRLNEVYNDYRQNRKKH